MAPVKQIDTFFNPEDQNVFGYTAFEFIPQNFKKYSGQIRPCFFSSFLFLCENYLIYSYVKTFFSLIVMTLCRYEQNEIILRNLSYRFHFTRMAIES